MTLTRKTPLKQGAPLRRIGLLARGAALLQGGPLRRTPMKPYRPRPAVPRATQDAIAARSHGWCEIALGHCTGRATDRSHRITTKMGGRHRAAKVQHDRLSDVMDACRWCHDFIGDNPTQAKKLGLALEEWQDPTVEPVAYRGRRALLDDAGGVDYIGGSW